MPNTAPHGNDAFTVVKLNARQKCNPEAIELTLPDLATRLSKAIFSRPGAILLGLAAGASVFAYGVLAWLGEDLWTVLGNNKDMAPWIAGAVTAGSVYAAVRNTNKTLEAAMARDARGDQQKREEEQKKRLAMHETFKAITTYTDAVAFLFRKAIDDNAEFGKALADGTVDATLKGARMALARFPAHTIGREVHTRAFFALELAVQRLTDLLPSIKADGGKFPDQQPLITLLANITNGADLLRRPIT